MKINKTERVALSGGLIGALFTNPKTAINKVLSANNVEGWYCRQVLPHSTSNVAVLIFELIVLCCTFGLWTFGAGYLLLLEKDSNQS